MSSGTAPSRTDRSLLPAVVLGLVLLAIVFALHARHWAGPFDDSYIGYRVARNLASGHGPVFNPGERVECATNFLWIVVLSGAHLVGLPIPATSTILGILAGVALLGVSWLLGRRSGLSPLAALAPVLLLTLNPDLATWAGSGMGTAAFSLLVSATLLSYLATPRRWAAGSLLATATALVRPDGVLVAFAVGVARLLDRRPLRETAKYAFGFGLLFGGYFAWRWSWFGWFWPNTFYAKVGTTADMIPLGLEQLESWVRAAGTWLVVPAVAILAIRRRLGRAERLLASTVLLTVAYIVFVGGDVFIGYRFFAPVLAPVYILIARGAAALAPRTRWRPAATVVGVCGLAAFAWFTATSYRDARGDWGPPIVGDSFGEYVRAKQGITEEYFLVGEFLRKRYEDDTTIALNAVGVIPFITDFPSIDMLGLTDEHIAHVEVEIGQGIRAHEKYDVDYVLARAPDIIIVGFPMLTVRPLPPNDLATWARLFHLESDAALVRDPRLRRRYRPASFRLPDGLFVNLLENRETIRIRIRPSPGDGR